jgi:hypothetical protein
MGMFTEDIEIGAALYEYHLEEMERKQAKLEKKKANDIYEYHVNGSGMKYCIADMDDKYLINCYKYFRKNYEYKRAFSFYIELRLRYPDTWREKIQETQL